MDGNPKGQSCGNCRFWYRTAGDGHGLCRRHPPHLEVVFAPVSKGIVTGPENVSIEPRTYSFYPQIKDVGWCGEYEPDPEMATQGSA